MVTKDETSPLKQQTLESFVKKSKHGRSMAKNLDVKKKENGGATETKEDLKYDNTTLPELTTKEDNVPAKKEGDSKPKPNNLRKKEPDTKPIRGNRSKNTGQQARKEGKASRNVNKTSQDKSSQKMTDFFPVRRSKRQPLSKIKDLEYQELQDKIKNKCTDGLEIRMIDGKGRGVFSTQHFARKDFIVEYSGQLISHDEAKKRELEYAQEPDKYGCYMYYFIFKNKKYCVDGTAEDGSLGRLLNHSVNGNVESKLVNVGCKPVLILVAKTDIPAETELCYDYGERSKDIIQSHPWLVL